MYLTELHIKAIQNPVLVYEGKFFGSFALYKSTLIAGFEEKRKQIEAEHSVVELTGAPLDSLDNRPSFTRKLRRRQNDPVS